MKKILFGSLVAISLIAFAGCNGSESATPESQKSAKCGGDKKASKCGDDKKAEGMKCGTGKCGGDKK